MRFILIISLGLVSGCSMFEAKPVATVKPFCRAFKPQTVSKDDVLTEETARGMEGGNRALAKLCP